MSKERPKKEIMSDETNEEKKKTQKEQNENEKQKE